MQPFKRDSKHSNANSNHSNQIPSFERKFELFERETKHLNANANHSNQTQSIWMQTLTIRIKFEAFECNHSKGIRSIRMQIWTIPTKFHHSNAIRTIWKGFEAFKCIYFNIEKGF